MQMVLDSLQYWVTEMHVDGFRFDLAATLGRGPAASIRQFDLRRDPAIAGAAGIKFIAEPWDIGPGGYQLGNFPPAGRNGTTAIATRCAGIGEARGMLPELAAASPARPISSTAMAAGPGPPSIS